MAEMKRIGWCVATRSSPAHRWRHELSSGAATSEQGAIALWNWWADTNLSLYRSLQKRNCAKIIPVYAELPEGK